VELFPIGERALDGLRPQSVEGFPRRGQAVLVHLLAVMFIDVACDVPSVRPAGRALLEERAVLTDGGVGDVMVIAVAVRRLIGEALSRRTEIRIFLGQVRVPGLAEHPLLPAETPPGDDPEDAPFDERLRDPGREVAGIECDRLEREMETFEDMVEPIEIDGAVRDVPGCDVYIDDEIVLGVDRPMRQPEKAFRLLVTIHVSRIRVGPAHLDEPALPLLRCRFQFFFPRSARSSFTRVRSSSSIAPTTRSTSTLSNFFLFAFARMCVESVIRMRPETRP